MEPEEATFNISSRVTSNSPNPQMTKHSTQAGVPDPMALANPTPSTAPDENKSKQTPSWGCESTFPGGGDAVIPEPRAREKDQVTLSLAVPWTPWG